MEISDYKEVFLLHDKDQDGVLSFIQLCLVIRTLGIRIQGREAELTEVYPIPF